MSEHAYEPRSADEQWLLVEEADAWFEYLAATRNQVPESYDEIEPWAWARLSQRLRAVGGSRGSFGSAAA